MPRRLCAVLLFGALAAPSLAQKSADETVRSMTVADGLQVELFAAEPMLINPTSIDVDHLGRVWVCEGVNYRRIAFKRPILREAGDRIVVLTDKDGDGKADDSTVFYQGKDLYGPLGIAVAPLASGDASAPRGACKVFVCQSPDILLFEDKDGDAKADGPPKKFLTGFGGFDHDHGVHGIFIGPDGKLYFTVGDSGVKGLQSSDGKGRKWESNTTDVQKGTVWRCDFDGTNLELIAHNFRNNYEACVNSFGEVWLSDNDDDGNQQTRICFVMPGGNYGYGPRGPGQTHWHEEQPGIVHKALRTGFGSPTGICFYEGTLLPKKYHGQLLHTDAGPRELRCFHIKPKGAGYDLTQENLVTSTDNWFRLSDVCVAPDGSLILADWYDPGVGGHGMGDWTRGRIYRVTPKGHKGYKVPAMTLDTKEGMLAALGSPCLATRAIALARLRSLGNSKADMFLESAAEVDSDFLFARLWFEFYSPTRYEKTGPEGSMIRKQEGTDSGPPKGIESTPAKEPSDKWKKRRELVEVRALWVRLSIDIHTASIILSSGGFNDFAKSGSIQELRELLIGMRNLPVKDVGDRETLFGAYSPTKAFYALAKRYDGQDHFYRAALNIACGTDPKRREAILADFDSHFPEWNDKVADLVWELRPASVLPRLGKLLEDPKLTPAQKGRVVDILAVNDDPAAGSALLKVLGRDVPPEMKARAVENLRTFLPTKWKDLKKGDAVRDAITGLLKSADGKLSGLQLAAAAPDCTTTEVIEALASDPKAATEVRVAAVRVIGRSRHIKFFHILKPLVPDPVLGPSAVDALGEYVEGKGVNSGAREAMDMLQGLVLGEKTATELRQAAVRALAGSRTGTQWLIAIKERGGLPDALAADTGRLLRNSPFQGERNKALLLFPAPGKLDPKKLPSPAVLAQRTGDVKRGEQLFQASLKGESQCMRCHMVRGVGGSIGPDLSMIGKKASKENLFESVLVPSKAIADQHLQWKVDTTDGKTVTGLLVSELETSITLRDANGKDHTFAARDLDGPKQKSLVSIMPDNLVAALTEDELTDLVEYMLTLKTASLTPESWQIVGPFPNGVNDTALDADLGLESTKAIDPTVPLQGPNGPLEWGTVRVNASGYVDLTAHYPGKSANSASYLYRVIESPADQDGVILFGNDDGAKVWVNGEKVFENRDHFAATPARHRFPVKLKKGPNAVLIKIVNGNDPHGLYFALTSEQELKVGK